MKTVKKSLRSTSRVTRADIVLILGCLLASVLIGIFLILHHDRGSMARISCNGAEIAVIVFKESGPDAGERFYLIRNTDADVTIEVCDKYPALPEEGSFNLIVVTDGGISMTAADCKDQICVHHRLISSVGESIICLPHKLVVEIVDEMEGNSSHSGTEQEMQMENAEETLDGVVE